MSRRTNKVVAQAAGQVTEARARLIEWETTKAGAESELARLQAATGDEVLDDPDAVSRMPRLMQEQRDTIEVADRAIAAQRGRVTVAERAYLSAEADALEPAVAQKRTELEQHNRRTAELLAELAKHEGVYVPERELLEERASFTRSHGDIAAWSRDLTRSEILEGAVVDADLPVRVLRAMSAGQDPAPLLGGGIAGYPTCVWGPDALVPAPAYLRTAEAQRTAEQQRQTSIDVVRRRIEELEGAIARGEKSSASMQEWTLGRAPSLPEQLEQAQRQLAGLTQLANA